MKKIATGQVTLGFCGISDDDDEYSAMPIELANVKAATWDKVACVFVSSGIDGNCSYATYPVFERFLCALKNGTKDEVISIAFRVNSWFASFYALMVARDLYDDDISS